MANDLNDILDDLDALADDESDVSLGDVLEKIGPRGRGVILLVPGFIGVSPVGAIPLVPTVLGVFTLLVAVQVLMGRDYPWLPGMLRDRAVKDEKLKDAVAKARGPAQWIDRHFGSRLEALTKRPAEMVAALLCVAFACVLPPLEIVPFAALVPFGAIALLGLALSLKDGVLMLVAFAASAAALYAVWMFLPFT